MRTSPLVAGAQERILRFVEGLREDREVHGALLAVAPEADLPQAAVGDGALGQSDGVGEPRETVNRDVPRLGDCAAHEDVEERRCGEGEVHVLHRL